jgi:hypothetical protein
MPMTGWEPAAEIGAIRRLSMPGAVAAVTPPSWTQMQHLPDKYTKMAS